MQMHILRNSERNSNMARFTIYMIQTVRNLSL